MLASLDLCLRIPISGAKFCRVGLCCLGRLADCKKELCQRHAPVLDDGHQLLLVVQLLLLAPHLQRQHIQRRHPPAAPQRDVSAHLMERADMPQLYAFTETSRQVSVLRSEVCFMQMTFSYDVHLLLGATAAERVPLHLRAHRPKVGSLLQWNHYLAYTTTRHIGQHLKE